MPAREPLLLEPAKRKLPARWPWALAFALVLAFFWWHANREAPRLVDPHPRPAPAPAPMPKADPLRESRGTVVLHVDRVSPTEEIEIVEPPPSAQGDLFNPGLKVCVIYKNSEFKSARMVCSTQRSLVGAEAD